MVHGRSVRQIKRLINRIYTPDDYIYIHVDARNQMLFDELKGLEIKENIKVTDNRFITIWGGHMLFEMQFHAMLEMFDLKWDFDFWVNLSGADYVLKKPQDFKHFLRQYLGGVISIIGWAQFL